MKEEDFKNYQVVVMTDQPLDFCLRVNKFCHENKIAFISTETHGVFANIFCDFGDNFEIIDSNGEPPQSLLIANITQVTFF